MPVIHETVYDEQGNPVMVGPDEVQVKAVVFETSAGVYVHADGTPLTKAEAGAHGLDSSNQPDSVDDTSSTDDSSTTDDTADNDDSSEDDTADDTSDTDDESSEDDTSSTDDTSTDDTDSADDGSGDAEAAEDDPPPEEDSTGTPDPTGTGPPPDGWREAMLEDENFQIDWDARRTSNVDPSPIDDLDAAVSSTRDVHDPEVDAGMNLDVVSEMDVSDVAVEVTSRVDELDDVDGTADAGMEEAME